MVKDKQGNCKVLAMLTHNIRNTAYDKLFISPDSKPFVNINKH